MNHLITNLIEILAQKQDYIFDTRCYYRNHVSFLQLEEASVKSLIDKKEIIMI